MIPTVKEPDLGAEHCCFCWKFTRTWTNLPERNAIGQQVACCPPCSRTHRPLQVPSKRAWYDLEQAREWARGRVHVWHIPTPRWARVRAGIIRRGSTRVFGGFVP